VGPAEADAAGHEDVGFSSPKFEWNVYHSTCLKWSEASGEFIRNRLIFGRDGPPPEAANGQGVALVVVRDVCDRFLSSYAKYVQLWRRGKVPLGDPLEDANEFLTKHKHDLSSHHVLFRRARNTPLYCTVLNFLIDLFFAKTMQASVMVRAE
jgi:hypothetical protein